MRGAVEILRRRSLAVMGGMQCRSIQVCRNGEIRGWARHRYARQSCVLRAHERGRYGAASLRRTARYDEKRPLARAKRTFRTSGTCYTSDLRHPDDGPIVGWLVLGHAAGGSAAAGHRKLRALHLSNLCRSFRQLRWAEIAGHRRTAGGWWHHGEEPDHQSKW